MAGATQIGDVAIRIGADTTELKKATSELQKFGKVGRDVGAKLATAFAAAAIEAVNGI